jgi:hypothetical protein
MKMLVSIAIAASSLAVSASGAFAETVTQTMTDVFGQRYDENLVDTSLRSRAQLRARSVVQVGL